MKLRVAMITIVGLLLLPAMGIGLVNSSARPGTAAAEPGNCSFSVTVDGVATQEEFPDSWSSFCEEIKARRLPSPLPSPSPSPMAGACGEDVIHWHPPVVGSCETGHEHGAAPPEWVLTSSWMPMFDHPGNTPNENALKHTSFKGFLLRDDNTDIYLIAHLDVHPAGQQTRFHSYQVWARDTAGGVSHWDLWMDFGEGDNPLPNIRATDGCGNDGVRPIIMVNYPNCPSVEFENWYSRSGSPQLGWDLGFNMAPNYFGGPAKGTLSSGNLADSATWMEIPNSLNVTRRVEMAWYEHRDGRRGFIWTDQWGMTVSGPDDPQCGTQRTVGGRAYTTLCIEQYIAPTMHTVQFPGNSQQVTYPSQGVSKPN